MLNLYDDSRMIKQQSVTGSHGQHFTLFYGGPLSNFFRCKELRISGRQYRCTEQYYMYRKALFFNDSTAAQSILDASRPGVMKAMGRNIRGFNRKAWEKESIRVMIEANVHKYLQNPPLRASLERTAGSTIVEASPTDTIWGIGLGVLDSRATDPTQWKGQNLLGRILQVIRDCLLSRQFQNAENVIQFVTSKFDC